MAFRRNRPGPDASGPPETSGSSETAGSSGMARSGGELASRSSGVERHRPEALPDAKPMPLGDPATRDVCWARLPGEARARLRAAAGEQIEWWARRVPGADGFGGTSDRWPQAVIFGEQALCFAEPRVTTDHRPVHVIDRFDLDPASHRRAAVVFTPSASEPVEPEAASAAAGAEVRRISDPTAAWRVAGLSPAAIELVGNLPVRAQALLMAPFDAAHPVLVCDWYYEGRANRLSVFAVVLAGARQATLAHGSRVTPVGHDDRSSHWSLVCRRATVRGRSSS